MNTLDPSLIDDIVQRLVAEFNPEQIILFGSYAWGNPTSESDIDLCIVVDEISERPIQRVLRAYHALSGLNISKDVLIKTRPQLEYYNDVAASLERKILNQGIIIYDRAQAQKSQPLARQSVS